MKQSNKQNKFCYKKNESKLVKLHNDKKHVQNHEIVKTQTTIISKSNLTTPLVASISIVLTTPSHKC